MSEDSAGDPEESASFADATLASGEVEMPDGDKRVKFLVFARCWSEAGEQLSPSELAVARRAMSGASNEEIALERGTKASTVARQLHGVYAKLEVSGRTELAQALLRD